MKDISLLQLTKIIRTVVRDEVRPIVREEVSYAIQNEVRHIVQGEVRTVFAEFETKIDERFNEVLNAIGEDTNKVATDISNYEKRIKRLEQHVA